MKIKNVTCEQFAGIQNREFEFSGGLNLVIGENESGKSTLIDLIYYMLFKNIKLDGRRDSDFINTYFPKKISGFQGDVIDGALVFETSNGTYKLKKEWEKGGGVCKLTCPDGTSIKKAPAIAEILSKELRHREGIYNEIIFASQKRPNLAIESIMNSLSKKTKNLSKTREDFSSALTQAVLETGGVSLEKIERHLTETMESLISLWDFTADLPKDGVKRGIHNKWKKNVGKILNAYYEMEEIRKLQKDAESAEKLVEYYNKEIQELQKKKDELQNKKDKFQQSRGALYNHSLLSDKITQLNNDIATFKEAYEKWPQLDEKLKKANHLKDKQSQAIIRDHFKKAEKSHEAYNQKLSELEKLIEVNPDSLENIRHACSEKTKAESKIASLNLVAKIKQLGKTPIKIRSSISGELFDINNGEIPISEAVEITVPGVMEIQLMPQGVNVNAIKQKLARLTSDIQKEFDNYNVNTLEELKEMSDLYNRTKSDVEQLMSEFNGTLGNYTWDTLKSENENIPEFIETENEVKKQIQTLCGSKPIDNYIGSLEQTLKDYTQKYTTIENLRSKIDDAKTHKRRKQETLNKAEKIPEEFQNVDDPDQYDKSLQDEINHCSDQINNYINERTASERSLGEKSAEEYLDELSDRESEFASKKAEYEHWQNIYDIFLRMKEQSSNNPIEDIASKFKEYLGIISEGGLELTSIDEQLSAKLASGTHALTYDILSDGTKDTISLAFRLAMLEHLYPEGDGLAIFDDPFTDMDPKRTTQACKLIQKYAENNQVIFITCDSKYKNMISGNVIEIKKD